MLTEFSIGKIVHLKSGSPDLKIIAVHDDNVVVEWHDESGNSKQGTFPKPCLS